MLRRYLELAAENMHKAMDEHANELTPEDYRDLQLATEIVDEIAAIHGAA